MGESILKCLECGKEYKKFRLVCESGCDSLLRSRYMVEEFRPGREKNIFKFRDWLPCKDNIETPIGPVVYKSGNLAGKLGLKNLYCAFNGYWPERGAQNMTGTFKDYEALPTLLNFLDNGKKKIIVSSAGNTARAFAYAATLLDFDTYIVIPAKMLHKMWIPANNAGDKIHIIAIADSGDYFRAIKLGNKISNCCGIDPEGGARNVARRDGMGTVMLEAARVMGKLPDHYFQAVGSGTGGIAAYEASLRLLEMGKFEIRKIPKLHLVQNAPFAPIYSAWKEKVPINPDENIKGQLHKINKMYADVLANRNPPFYTRGGVRDVLNLTGGVVHAVSNKEAREASELFEEQEGIDIVPAAAVCAAALIKAVKKKSLDSDETILLNITGGGLKKIKGDYRCRTLEPEVVVENEPAVDWNKIL